MMPPGQKAIWKILLIHIKFDPKERTIYVPFKLTTHPES